MIDVPFVEWDSFYRSFRWKQGEHVTLIGPTGQGKTTLAHAILPKRDYVVVFATKKRDSLLKEFIDAGYSRLTEWDMPADVMPKVLLHPPFQQSEPKEAEQRKQFKAALDRAFEDGSWTVYLDEVPYIANDLNLERPLKRLWHQGRSLLVSIIASTQRPTNIPLLAYSQATHLFFFRTTDENDMKRIGGLGGIDRKTIAEAVGVLKFHEVLYLNTRSGKMVRTKVNK